MKPAFWKGRQVFVTGHTGFKGSWLCWWLTQLGAKVSGLALEPPTSPSLFESSGLANAMVSRVGDIRDPAALASALRELAPEIVIHMAAQSLVRESHRDPVGTFTTNVVGTVNCLEAVRSCDRVRAVVVVTSDKCYRNRELSRGYVESDELGGDDPYAASKACAEIVTHAYRQSFYKSQGGAALVASVRSGNVIGGGDWANDRLVPDAMRAFAASRPLQIRHPASTRPWQHVLDPLCGYLTLAERLFAGEAAASTAWNFGPETAAARPVSWVADELVKRWGGGATWKRDEGSHLHESNLLSLDSSKARSELGWRPLLAIESAVEWVVEWHKGLEARGNARDLTLAQVARYQAMVA